MVRRSAGMATVLVMVSVCGSMACHSEQSPEDKWANIENMTGEQIDSLAEEEVFNDTEVDPDDDLGEDPDEPLDGPTPEDLEDAESDSPQQPFAAAAPDPMNDCPREPARAKLFGVQMGRGNGLVKGTNAGQIAMDTREAMKLPAFGTLRNDWRKEKYSLRGVRQIVALKDSGADLIRAVEPHIQWVREVTGAGLEPTLAIAPVYDAYGEPRKMSPDDFYKKLSRLLRMNAFKCVRYWAINEPEHVLPKVHEDIRRFNEGHADRWRALGKKAALYMRAARRALNDCRKLKNDDGTRSTEAVICDAKRLVGGEFISTGEDKAKRNLKRVYLTKYFTYILWNIQKKQRKDVKDLAGFPRIWSLHNYADPSRGGDDLTATREFVEWIEERQKKSYSDGLSKMSFRVWSTETGTLLSFETHCGISEGQVNVNGNNPAQYGGARTVFAMTGFDRVDRIYWYAFQQSVVG